MQYKTKRYVVVFIPVIILLFGLDSKHLLGQAKNAIRPTEFYISPNGNDGWSGKLPAANADKSDGPFLTIQRALEQVRKLNGYPHYHPLPGDKPRVLSKYKTIEPELFGGLNGPVIIWLREGRYPVHTPIQLTLADTYPITFAAYADEKPIIDGGIRITDWKIQTINGIRMWTRILPNVKSGDWVFRQLFVNDRRATRPRLPAHGFYIVKDPLMQEGDLSRMRGNNRFVFEKGDIRDWRNMQDIDIVAVHYWTEDRMPIKTVDFAKQIVETTVPSCFPLLAAHPAHGAGNAPYYVDNVWEALDEPGEWYLDQQTGKLYYIPLPDEKPETSEVYAPKAEQLFVINGHLESGHFIENIRFQGIEFQNTKYLPLAHFGTGNNAGNSGPGVVYLEAARYCRFENCIFKHLGEYAIEFAQGCTNHQVSGCNFHDLGSGAIKIHGRHGDEYSNIRTGLSRITDNEIHTGGLVFHGAPAIVMNGCFSTWVAHNHISDFYYSGITCHGTQDMIVEKNHIHHIGKGWLSDMGAISTARPQTGAFYRGNIIHDIEAAIYGANCIYIDDWATHVVVENNLMYNSNTDLINVKGMENVIRNNILAFGRDGITRRTSPLRGGHYVAVVENNIFLLNNSSVFRSGYGMDVFDPVWKSDLNLFWELAEKQLTVEQLVYGGNTREYPFKDWKQRTHNDQHSINKDPGFIDPLNGDFALPENSPAFDIGFQPVDFSDVGPRDNVEVKSTVREKSIKGHVE